MFGTDIAYAGQTEAPALTGYRLRRMIPGCVVLTLAMPFLRDTRHAAVRAGAGISLRARVAVCGTEIACGAPRMRRYCDSVPCHECAVGHSRY
eukprot:1885207-Rhodomonas_salina.2